MKTGDRLLRSLFVALAVGLAWGIRGDFGHLIGAMYPGAALGLAFAYITAQRSMFKWMPFIAMLSGLGIATGGHMSYGILHGYAQSDTFINYSYGFFTLFLQGGAWGAFGCALIGLVLEKDRLKPGEWASLIATVIGAGFFFELLIVGLLGFHINPPRSNASIAYTGAVIAMLVWLIRHHRSLGLRAAILGYIGFGIGMSFSRLLSNASRYLPWAINHWNIMEVGAGFFGGLIFTYGMLGIRFPEQPEEEDYPWLNKLGMFYVLGMIPLLHRLTRIELPKRIEEWTKSLQGYGYENPDILASRILLAINTVVILGFIAAAFACLLHQKNLFRFSGFPIFYFSITMILFQNLAALYFFYPRQPNHINMHSVFWILYALMAIIAFAWNKKDLSKPLDQLPPFAWKKWTAFALCVFIFTILAAGFINGEKTMSSANTRWPIWSWSDGPFPGR